jgi:hypothetical protein
VLALDAAARKVTARVAGAPGLVALRFEPGGRWAFAVNRQEGTVSVLDASTGKQAHRLEGFAAPDAITFSNRYAYVRNTQSNKVGLIDLHPLGRTDVGPSVAEVEMTQTPAGVADDLSSPIAANPDGSSVMVVGGEDRAVYYYREGMMAPMGTHKNYGRRPRSALILDRSLAETAPGVYTTTVRLPNPGRYQVAMLLDSPRVATCMPVTVEGKAQDDDAAPAARVKLTARFDEKQFLTAGQPATLRFQATDAQTHKPIESGEVNAVFVRMPGTWQWRGSPRHVGGGEWQVDVTPPSPGQYKLVVGVDSHGAPVGSLSAFTLGVVDGTPTRSTDAAAQEASR